MPLLIAVQVQAATGLGRVSVVALAALGGPLVNVPLSYYLTLRLGVSGVIWGTVLTTLVSNLLIPAAYTFRVLEIRPGPYLRRSLLPPMAGGAALLASSWALNRAGYPAIAEGRESGGQDIAAARPPGGGRPQLRGRLPADRDRPGRPGDARRQAPSPIGPGLIGPGPGLARRPSGRAIRPDADGCVES